MMKKIIGFLPWLLVMALVFFIFTNRCDNRSETPDKVDVVDTGTFKVDSISPVRVIEPVSDEIYKFKSLDSTEKIKSFKEAVSIREYKEVLSDSNQVIVVSSKVKGELFDMKIDYTLKPVEKKIIREAKRGLSIYLGAETSLSNPVGNFSGKAYLVSDKIIYSYGYTFETKTHTVGLALKILD